MLVPESTQGIGSPPVLEVGDPLPRRGEPLFQFSHVPLQTVVAFHVPSSIAEKTLPKVFVLFKSRQPIRQILRATGCVGQSVVTVSHQLRASTRGGGDDGTT